MKKLLLFMLISFTLIGVSSAHSGRTDSSGGHNNHSNGTYHYHNSGSSTSSSGDELKKFFMLVGIFVFGVPLIDWIFDLFPNSSRKKEKALVRKQINTNKQNIEANLDLTTQENNRSDYDLFSQEIVLINKAIDEKLIIEFLYDGSYRERIRFKPIQLSTGNKDLIVMGIWIKKLDEEIRSFALRKMSEIRIVN